MIIKGKSRAGAGSLASHLGNAEKNERVSLMECRGTVARDLRGALVEMEAYGAGTNCTKPLYHAAISPQPPHRLTEEQRLEAVDALEKKLGLDGHARVVMVHEKLGREHIHVVWSRIDMDRMTAVHDGHNYRKHEECARALERQFGHARVQGAHAERDGVKRPERTPAHWEMQQQERTRVQIEHVRSHATEAFRGSDGPAAFRAALEEKGYQLARGDRRDFLIVDRAGGYHNLAKRIEGVKAADLRAYMASLDVKDLPNLKEAQRIAKDRRDELAEDRSANRLEKSYGRGNDYVSQSSAALRDHKQRQRLMDERTGRDSAWERIESGEKRRREEDSRKTAETGSGSSSDEPTPTVELTDEMQARLDRLREAKANAPPLREGPGRQGQAPGGGHARGR